MNGENSAQKLGKRNKLSKSVSGYSKTKKEKKTKWHGTLSHKGGGQTLVVRPLKKHFFYVCPPLSGHIMYIVYLVFEPH